LSDNGQGVFDRMSSDQVIKVILPAILHDDFHLSIGDTVFSYRRSKYILRAGISYKYHSMIRVLFANYEHLLDEIDKFLFF